MKIQRSIPIPSAIERVAALAQLSVQCAIEDAAAEALAQLSSDPAVVHAARVRAEDWRFKLCEAQLREYQRTHTFVDTIREELTGSVGLPLSAVAGFCAWNYYLRHHKAGDTAGAFTTAQARWHREYAWHQLNAALSLLPAGEAMHVCNVARSSSLLGESTCGLYRSAISWGQQFADRSIEEVMATASSLRRCSVFAEGQ